MQQHCMRASYSECTAFIHMLADTMDGADTTLHGGYKTCLSQSCVTEASSQLISANTGWHFSNGKKTVPFSSHCYSATDPLSSCLENLNGNLEGEMLSQCKPDITPKAENVGQPTLSTVQKGDARSRWKCITHVVTLVNHMAANVRSDPNDISESSAVDEVLLQQGLQDDAGGVGAATFEGAKTVARTRCKGRKGMEGLLVRQGTGFLSFFQGFYVAFLKMPIGYFSIGVLFAPVVLGLLFTPLYLLDEEGLAFNGSVELDATMDSYMSTRQRLLTSLNVFLYALSLSTTFGGSPIYAQSPFCLLLANINTLLAQFLFVFLSGAVFARMSQPSYPIRFSKKAIIKTDDLLPVLGLEQQEVHKVFGVRLVLTGPSPCELVDVKICLTFRIFVKLPTGSVFCSTQDLEIVRPQVSYLRYGLMVRHIIDKKSPVYGHDMESLHEGDASFSLTVMGMERTSMQPVFHLEDYFVCDGDVVWEGDYVDFIHVGEKGQRVLDHSQIDSLKPVKAALGAAHSVSSSRKSSPLKPRGQDTEFLLQPGRRSNEDVQGIPHDSTSRSWLTHVHRRKLLKSLSNSFTRAEW